MLTITIRTDKGPAQDSEEVARILMEYAQTVMNHGINPYACVLRDINGDVVGKAEEDFSPPVEYETVEEVMGRSLMP